MGASENAASATTLLKALVEGRVDQQRRYLFVIDGSKELRAAINRLFGYGSIIQRCRQYKTKNICNKLPDDLAAPGEVSHEGRLWAALARGDRQAQETGGLA